MTACTTSSRTSRRTLNLGILAHVDAGKTSLTERLLFAAGVIDRIGRVDAGSTQTDTLALERQRGITIRSAVVSFRVADTVVNLIDTPGHPDFIAEVERVLGVLDGVVLVVSAVEGVQAQTRVLMRSLRRLQIPTLIFVNKVDRIGARDHDVVDAITDKLGVTALPMETVSRLGTRAATVRPLSGEDHQHVLIDALADHDDRLLERYVAAPAIPYEELRASLITQTRSGLLHPVFFGSATTGAGTDELIDAIATMLPTSNAHEGGQLSGTVFKIERGRAGEKVAYVRLFDGALRARDRLPTADGGESKVTALEVFDGGPAHAADAVGAGQIARVWGLHEARIGDAIGERRPIAAYAFAPPTLETVVRPHRGADRARLHTALSQLAEQDPLIGFRADGDSGELSVSLYGEVQKEVVGATLADDYGIAVAFSPTRTICIERVIGAGAAVELINEETNPFFATVGLRVEPGPLGSGVDFGLETYLHGTLPLAFVNAVTETVFDTLRQGLHGWEVTDCRITMTHSGYYPRQSHAHATFDKSMSSVGADFRGLTPLVLMTAMRRAGTQVYEPISAFTLELPSDRLTVVLSALARLGGVPGAPTTAGALTSVTGEIPAAQVHRFTQLLPGLTRGEGLLDADFDHHEPVRGPVPRRPRTGPDPLNRLLYLQHVKR